MRGPSAWERWDEEVAAGGRPSEVLPRLSDESIVDLLRCAGREGRDYERDLLLVEMGNRVVRLRREVARVRQLAEDAVAAMERRGARAERLFEAAGATVPPEVREEGRGLAREAREHAATLRRELDASERLAFANARDRE